MLATCNCDMPATLGNSIYLRLDRSVGEFFVGEEISQRLRSDLEQILGTPDHLELDDSLADSGKNLHVVTLPWPVFFSFVGHGVERTPAGVDASAVGVCLQLLCRALGFGGRVGLREHDGPLVVRRHLLEDFFCEYLRHCRHSDQNRRIHELDG